MAKENNQQTPEWLRRLEDESWQAELIISGLALYGSFQLPQFVYDLIDLLINYLPSAQYFTGYMMAYLLLLGVSILSGFFIIHFVLRAYWIGLIGLNSVYPNGYGEGDFYSPIFANKFKALLPEVSDTIENVDKICSSIFAGAFAFIMIYGVGAIVVGILLLIYNLLSGYIPPVFLQAVYWLIGLTVFSFITFSLIANFKRFRESEKIQHAYFLASKYFGYLFSPFFFKPINQISMTFYSNFKKGKSGNLLPFAFIVIAVILSMYHLNKSNLRYLILKGRSEVPFFQQNRIYPEFYEDGLSEKKGIINSVIPSQKISDPLLKVFIPVFESENFIQEAFCEPYQRDESKRRFENRRLKSEQQIFCYRKYHQVFVNDSLYRVDFLAHNHPHKNEFGLLCYIPTEAFKLGLNEVRTVKLKNPEGEVYDELTIPFWFSIK